MPKEHWMDTPEEHDFPAAASYLSLLFEPSEATSLVGALKAAATAGHFKAKDILRASGLPLLPRDNAHVALDLDKVKAGHSLSPVLIVRGQPCIIADGYHRVCASYQLDEDADIPCRIVSRT